MPGVLLLRKSRGDKDSIMAGSWPDMHVYMTIQGHLL